MITDKLRSYGAARRQVVPDVEQRAYKGLNKPTRWRSTSSLLSLSLHRF
jgi:transposase-like protein